MASPSAPPAGIAFAPSLDPRSAATLERIVALVQKVFDVPVVLVSHVVDDRHHFLATTGFSARDADLDYLPCSRVVTDAAPMIVEDVASAVDWADRYARGIGFYAGVPILDAAGNAMGALSLIDVHKRHVEDPARGVLEDCAALIAPLIRSDTGATRDAPPAAALVIDLFHDAGAAVLVTDSSDTILEANDALCHLVAQRVEALTGKPFNLLLPEEERANAAALYADLLAGRRDSYQADSRLIHRSGEERRVRTTVSLVRDDDGAPAYAIRLFEETGRRHEALEELRIRDRAIAGMNQALAVTDMAAAGAPIIFCNPAFERMTGYRQVDLLGSNMLVLRGARTARAAVDALAGAIERQEQASTRVVFYRRDTTPFTAAATIVPVWDDADTLTHYIWLLDDRSETVELRSQVEALHTELTRSTRQLQHAVNLVAAAYSIRPIEEHAQELLQSLYRDVRYLEAKVTMIDPETGHSRPVAANVAGNPIRIDRIDPQFGHSGRELCRIKMQMESAGEVGAWCLDVPLVTDAGLQGLLTLYAHPGRLFDASAATAAHQVAGRIADALSRPPAESKGRIGRVSERVALLPE
ncbi:MAG: PAS domain-containing protein [Rhodothermales bacterium]|nr:PAS domain-containing protein [Rhodothermales bacterium]